MFCPSNTVRFASGLTNSMKSGDERTRIRCPPDVPARAQVHLEPDRGDGAVLALDCEDGGEGLGAGRVPIPVHRLEVGCEGDGERLHRLEQPARLRVLTARSQLRGIGQRLGHLDLRQLLGRRDLSGSRL